MLLVEEAIYSPCSGTLEKVIAKENSHVYEWEKLLLIKTNSGRIVEVSVGISGYVTHLLVKEGQKVNSQTILATIQDDLLITGSD